MSAFVWLDYSERERQKMLDVVDAFREHDTRDELGIASVRDAFADMLFPGTSTIMTRARYFLLVPWTYQRLEELRISSADIAARARKAELSLIQPIEDSDDNDGNIGKVAKTALKRLPSSVYWQGLKVWGIRDFDGAQAQYHRGVDAYYAQLTRQRGRVTERDAEHDDLVSPNWHAGLVEAPAGFPAKCSLTLTRGEADYLSERVRLSPGCAGSLLAVLVAQPLREVEVAFAWEHPHCADLAPKLREILDNARNFSEVMHGAPLLYNLMLAEQAGWKEGMTKYLQSLSDWAKMIANRRSVLSEWNRTRFWEIVFSVNPRITPPTRDFVNGWWDIALDGGIQVRGAQAVRVFIRDRERRLKKTLARIDNPRAQELWNGDSGTSQMDFRWNISQRLLRDIFEGLEASVA
jgi:hypothetical protein